MALTFGIHHCNASVVCLGCSFKITTGAVQLGDVVKGLLDVTNASLRLDSVIQQDSTIVFYNGMCRRMFHQPTDKP